MSRRQEICRDFQRGNCRYGASCKYLHVLPQQQQQQQQQQQRYQQQQRPQQQRYEPERRENYYSALSDNGGSANRRQQYNQPQAAKEHKCNDPRACKDQIREDFANERPSFWRLTCYAHYKFLPNDIVGDVSPEELRALAYDGAKQGLSMKDIIQREASMVAVKNAEFDALLRNPYKGPASQNLADIQTGSFAASPFSSQPPSIGFMPIGATSNGSAASPAQVFPQPSFGAISPAPFSFGTSSGTASLTAPQQQTNLFQQSPFQGSTGPTPGIQSPFQSSFGPSPGMQSPFQSSTGTSSGMQSPFQSNAGASPPFQNVAGPSPGIQSSFFTPQGPSAAPSSQTSVFNSPTTPPQNFGTPPSSFTPQSTPASTRPAFGFQTMPTASLQEATPPKTQQGTNLAQNAEGSIWSKAVWKIGEIPEMEPPEEVRF